MELRVKCGESICEAVKKANELTEDVTIEIEAGEYEVPETVEIERDNIAIKAENAVLKGSRRIYLDNCETDGKLKIVDSRILFLI